MAALTLTNIGQIKHAEIAFGDLTVLVGPQATGKSIVLQFLKLVLDTGQVQDELKRHGMTWSGRREEFFDLYFGEGMRRLWHARKSRLHFNGEEIDIDKRILRQQRSKRESLFFIPAQRVLTLREGWPRPFTDYSPGDPFTVREFSEKLRLLVQTGFGGSDLLFPQTKRLKADLRDALRKTVFAGFGLKVQKHRSQKRLVLGDDAAGSELPFMVWSAGQREFIPLLLGLYWLLPPTGTPRRQDIEWAVIEELEMGLHPDAISTVMLLLMDLLARGYKVCLSTHSPHVLDVVWGLQNLREHDAAAACLLELFGVRKSQTMMQMAESAVRKTMKVYFFERESGRTHDISGLDPGAREVPEAGWGGLGEFSDRVAAMVAKVVG